MPHRTRRPSGCQLPGRPRTLDELATGRRIFKHLNVFWGNLILPNFKYLEGFVTDTRAKTWEF